MTLVNPALVSSRIVNSALLRTTALYTLLDSLREGLFSLAWFFGCIPLAVRSTPEVSHNLVESARSLQSFLDVADLMGGQKALSGPLLSRWKG
jgi:hypothetical protein